MMRNGRKPPFNKVGEAFDLSCGVILMGIGGENLVYNLITSNLNYHSSFSYMRTRRIQTTSKYDQQCLINLRFTAYSAHYECKINKTSSISYHHSQIK